jgi:hypothetical protein
MASFPLADASAAGRPHRRPWWKRASLRLALILALWGLVKTLWEVRLEDELDQMRYHGVKITAELRSRIGQNAMIGLLGGFRGVIADFAWLRANAGFQDEQWYAVKSMVDLATTLQPRFVPFWDLGGWHLAWNASINRRLDTTEPDEMRRLREERYWIDQGRQILERGTEANPEKYRLWFSLGMLHDQKLKDYNKAAAFYRLASEREDAPTYLERFPAYMWEKGGEERKAYQHWKMLWNRHRGADPDNKIIALDKIEENARWLEDKLDIPLHERIFTHPPTPKPEDQKAYAQRLETYRRNQDLPAEKRAPQQQILRDEIEKLEVKLGIPKEKRVFSPEGGLRNVPPSGATR